MNAPQQLSSRRPIQARDSQWAKAVAQRLAKMGMLPNQISMLSVACAAAAGACMINANAAAAPLKILLYVGAALLIQMRLLCNLFDGMVAVEGRLKSKSGEIFNELPDRFADAIILVCAGYVHGTWSFTPTLGWAAGTLAIITAYVRALGAASGASHAFCGPMAKQQRMAVVTVACLLAAGEAMLGWPPRIFGASLMIIVIGCVITITRRIRFILRELEAK